MNKLITTITLLCFSIAPHIKKKLLRNSILILFGLATVSCASQPSDWIDVPLREGIFYQQQLNFNSDVIEIPLNAQQDLEYMVSMKQGGSFSYNWRVENLSNPNLLLAEFHGHTIRSNDEPGEVMFYNEKRGDSSEGYLVAPFDGIHGWYFSNESSDTINIIINISGFHSLTDE